MFDCFVFHFLLTICGSFVKSVKFLLLLFLNMAISELLIGRIQGESKYRPLNSLAKQYKLSWATSKAVNYTGKRVRKTRIVPLRIRRRRRIVVMLAKKRACKQGRQYPVYFTASGIQRALLHKGISVSKATVLRYLRAGGLACRVRHRVPTRDPIVIKARCQFTWLRKSRDFKRIVWSDEHTVSINDHASRTLWVDEAEEVIPRERRRLQNTPRQGPLWVWDSNQAL